MMMVMMKQIYNCLCLCCIVHRCVDCVNAVCSVTSDWSSQQSASGGDNRTHRTAGLDRGCRGDAVQHRYNRQGV